MALDLHEHREPTTYGGRTLDRQLWFDPRSVDRYDAAGLLAELNLTEPRSYSWQPGPVLDQGREGACVGFGWTAELMATPDRVRGLSDGSALQLYREAQRVDEWPGEDYAGTSVLAAAKLLKARGSIEGYRWATNMDDLAVTVSRVGPVVLGTTWRAGMYETVERDGEQWLEPGGSVVGGHCYLDRGYSRRRDAHRIRNSWGAGWGQGGDAWIRTEHLAELLADRGEACVPLRRR